MKVAIRADASSVIGGGHIGRCVALAEALREQGAEVTFLTAALDRASAETLGRRGFRVHRLRAKSIKKDSEAVRALLGSLRPDWLVVDQPNIDRAWEDSVRPVAPRILVMDDTAERQHSADALVDPGRHPRLGTRDYAGKLPAACRLFLGPSFAMLRDEFRTNRRRARPARIATRVIISFGNADPTGETAKALEAIGQFEDGRVQFDVVLPAASPSLPKLRAACRRLPLVKPHERLSDMSAVLAGADFALGAGGVSLWERCAMGLPSLVVMTADNQRSSIELAARAGAIHLIGNAASVDAATMAQAVREFVAKSRRRRSMAEKARRLVDGRGAIRLAARMLNVRPGKHRPPARRPKHTRRNGS